jgi:hypothetical protein
MLLGVPFQPKPSGKLPTARNGKLCAGPSSGQELAAQWLRPADLFTIVPFEVIAVRTSPRSLARKAPMVPERLLKDIKRLSDADYRVLMTYQNQNYYGILGGDSEEALAQIAVVEEVEDEEDWEEDT